MFDKGITRVDKIKTVDIAIAYVEHLQLICKQYNIKEGEIKISESISIPVTNDFQPLVNVPTKMIMKNLSTLSNNKNVSTTTSTTTTTTVSSSTTANVTGTNAGVNVTTATNSNVLSIQPQNSSQSINPTNKVATTCNASTNTITPPPPTLVNDAPKEDNLSYMRGVFNGSIELTTFLIESVHTYLSDVETKYQNIELVIDVLRQFHNVYFMSQNINEKDIVFITKGK